MENIWMTVKRGKEDNVSKIKKEVESLGAEFYRYEYGGGTVGKEISVNEYENGNYLVRLLHLLKNNTQF